MKKKANLIGKEKHKDEEGKGFSELLLAARWRPHNALAEVPDASTLAWTDFEFKNRDLLNIQSPDTFSA